MKKVRSIIVILLIFTILVFAFNISATSMTTIDELGFSYSVTNRKTATVEKYNGSEENIEIPRKYNTYKVTAIADSAFSRNKIIRSITIPDTVTAIGEYAFYGCTNLEKVKISGNIKSLEAATFYGAASLKEVYIPSSVNNIVSNVFAGCTNLTIVGETGSYAEEFAAQKGITFRDINEPYAENLAGYSLILEPDNGIGVDFYMELSGSLKSSDTAIMKFTLPDESVVELSIKNDAMIKYVDNSEYCVYRCNVAAKEMTANIKAQIIDDEFMGDEYVYTVKQYADHILQNTDTNTQYANVEPLVRAMLIYGAQAQKYFNYNLQNLASDESLPNIDIPDDLVNFDPNTYDFSDFGLMYYGCSLVLGSKTSFVIYFDCYDEFAFKSLNVSLADSDATVKTSIVNGRFRCEITDISTGSLTKNISVKFNDISYTFNPGLYFVLAKNDNEAVNETTLGNVAKALYYYDKTAEGFQQRT